MSEVLVLGFPDQNGEVVLITPDLDVPDGRAAVLGRFTGSILFP